MSADLERLLRERLRGVDRHDAPDSLYASLEAIVRTKPQPSPKRDPRRTLRLLAVAAILVVGGAAVVTGGGWLFPPALVTSPVPSVSLPIVSSSPSTGPTIAPSVSPTASPSTPAPPSGGTAGLPVAGSAAPIGERVVMTPGRDGSLFAAIPDAGGTVVLHLDRTGEARPGWPIRIAGTTSCPVLLAVDDGSIRAVCSSREVAPRHAADARAFAFDATGTALADWPAELGPTNQLDEPALYTGRMIGDELTLSVSTKTAYEFVRVTTVTAAGEVRRGVDLALAGCCDEWAVGPDGVAYGVGLPSDLTTEPYLSSMTAVDLAGRRPGWPIEFDGIASTPTFGSDARIIVIVGYTRYAIGRALTFDAEASAGVPLDLPVMRVALSPGCDPIVARPPIAVGDGTIFVGGVERTHVALDPSVQVSSGWPFEAETTLARIGYDDPLASGFCPSVASSAAAADGTFYLPLAARAEAVGGSLVAVGRDGNVRAGWPVELTKPGADFWSVAVAADGTVYALALEPEAGNTTSATILAIAPDSTVLATITIIDPGAP